MKLNDTEFKVLKEFIETLISHGGDIGPYNTSPKEVEETGKEFLQTFNIENVSIKCDIYGEAIITKLEL